jgi:1,2-phenylacetyl-CoA epoxidase catalytic subunit
MSSAISELRKKEPLFFKTKWINQINDLIDQHNTQLDIQKHISGLSEIEKKRYSDHLNKWTEENQLLQPKSLLKNLTNRTSLLNNENLMIKFQI